MTDHAPQPQPDRHRHQDLPRDRGRHRRHRGPSRTGPPWSRPNLLVEDVSIDGMCGVY